MTTHPSQSLHPRQDTLSVRGCNLAYREMGDGPPVLFIHGTLAGMDTFRRQLLWFGHKSRAIAYSRRFHPPSGPEGTGAQGIITGSGDVSGAGQSAGPQGKAAQEGMDRLEGLAGPYSLTGHATDLIAFVKALGIAKPHLVGSSYGAYVAIRACLMEPGLASSLVAAEPPILRLLELTAEGRAALRAFKGTGLGPAREAFARGQIEKGVEHFFDGIRGEVGAFARLTDLQRADIFRFGPELRMELTTDFDLYMPPITLEEIQALSVPALLLTGEKSPRLFHVIIDHLRSALPSSQLRSIPSADHSIHTSAPAGYSEAVWEFISRHL